MELDPRERDLLVDELLECVTDEMEPLDPELLAEIERREADFAAGRTKTVDAFEAVDRLLKRKQT